MKHTKIRIRRIYISPGHDFKGRHGKGRLEHGIEELTSVECVAGQGLVGDRFFGYKEGFKGQITFIDQAAVDDLAERLDAGAIDPALFRRNVALEGADLNALIGKRFRIGEVTFSGSEECAPCYWMDEAVKPGAFELLKGRGGLRCRILSDGVLETGAATLEVE